MIVRTVRTVAACVRKMIFGLNLFAKTFMKSFMNHAITKRDSTQFETKNIFTIYHIAPRKFAMLRIIIKT